MDRDLIVYKNAVWNEENEVGKVFNFITNLTNAQHHDFLY